MNEQINKYFPVINAINSIAQNETGKRQHYRPIYSIHKWWARRPGSLFRFIILLFQKTETSVFNFSNQNISVSNSDYFQNHDLSDLVICDPFMGGGTTLVEANRLGAKVIGCDLNPVSYWIVRESLKIIDVNKLTRLFNQLDAEAGQKIQELYRTSCNTCGKSADTLYSFWLNHVTCPICGSKVHLFKRTLLNKGSKRTKTISETNNATTFCPNCFELNLWDGKELVACKKCNTSYNPNTGTYNKGTYSCSHCNTQNISLIKTLQGGQKINNELIALEYICDCNHNREYKSPDKNDYELMQKIDQEFTENYDQLIIPKQEIPIGDSSARWINHKFLLYSDVFNKRQILAFNYLFKAIEKINDIEYQNAFYTIFSNSLEYNNMMTPYNFPHRKLHHLFTYHALPLTTSPVENNFWGIGTNGAGTFTNCYLRYKKAKNYCNKPFDRIKNREKSIKTIYSENETIKANIVGSFSELLEKPKSALLLCKDSSNLSEVPDNSVDLVISDPPYFDSIHYSELSNFFYVWLRLLVEDKHFQQDHVPIDAEAIVNNGLNKDSNEYESLIRNVFEESHRILKDEGYLAFTFHHTKTLAWWTIVRAITLSGFFVVDYFPAKSEYKVNPHIRNKISLDMDLVIICKKNQGVCETKKNFDELVMGFESTVFEMKSIDRSQLFIVYMGEVFKYFSRNQLIQESNYQLFSDIIDHFEIMMENNSEKLVSEIGHAGNENTAQLSLFD